MGSHRNHGYNRLKEVDVIAVQVGKNKKGGLILIMT